jgi:hypothetical protein
VADVGDFGKYGLLRALCGLFPPAKPRLSLGVVWYLVLKEEAGTQDGKYDGYLNLKSNSRMERLVTMYRECDPDLYDALRRIRRNHARSVADLRTSSLLGVNAKFFEEPLDYDGFPWAGRATGQLRAAYRREWLERALKSTRGCDLVFLDPDNGLEARTTPIHALKAPKYVYFDDLAKFIARSQSLVIYHHLGMHDKHLAQIKDGANRIQKQLATAQPIMSLRYGRGTARVFYIVPSSREHEGIFRQRIKKLIDGHWGCRRHYELVSA